MEVCTFNFMLEFTVTTQNPSILDPRFLSLLFYHFMILLKGTEKRCCSALSEQWRNILERSRSITLRARISSSQQLGRWNWGPETQFLFGLDQSSTKLIGILPSSDCGEVKVKALEVWKLNTSLFFERNRVVQHALNAGTWSSHLTYTVFFLLETSPTAHGHLLHQSCGGWLLNRSCKSLD